MPGPIGNVTGSAITMIAAGMRVAAAIIEIVENDAICSIGLVPALRWPGEYSYGDG